MLGPQLGVVSCVLSLCLHVLTEASRHSCPTGMARECEGFSGNEKEALSGQRSALDWHLIC